MDRNSRNHAAEAKLVIRFKICILLFLLTSFCVLNVAQAQTVSEPSTKTTTQSPEAVRDMVSRLSDQEVRALLLERLDAVAETDAQATVGEDSTVFSTIGYLKFWAAGVADSVHLAFIAIPDLFIGQARSISNFFTTRGAAGSVYVLGVFLLAIALGLAVEWGVRKLTRGWNKRIASPIDPDSFRESVRLLSLRLFLELSGLIAFAVVAYIVLSGMPSPIDKEIFTKILFSGIVLPRAMLALIRFVFAPNRPELRLVHTDDWTANFTARHGLGLFLLIGIGASLMQFNRLNGVGPEETRLGFWLGVALHGYVIFIAWRTREGMTSMLIGKRDNVTATESKFARFYPYFLMGLSVMIWLIDELIAHLRIFHLIRNNPQTTTLLIFLFIPALDTLVRASVDNLVAPMQGGGPVAVRAYESTKRSYLRIARVLGFGLIIMILMDIWHIRLNTVATDAVGAALAANFIKLLIILSIGYLVWEMVSLFINRKLAAEQTAAGVDSNTEDAIGGEGGGAGSSRLSTILPLVRFTLQTIVIVMTVLIALSNIGINVTPLLAGAGVVGIAVGFGAQRLVGDVVSGIFFLIDDAFRAGEYVSIDDTVGTVEKISLRSMQLRHHRGAIHTIPYGEIPKLTNYSRDWVMMKIRFTVPFDTDLHKVKKLFKKIGAEVVDLPQFSDDLLQPFKSQGVLEVNDVGIVIGGKFTAKPGTQFMMRKELYLRVQKAFEENGIQFARKEVRVRLDGEVPEHLSEKQLSTIAAAAAEISDEKPEVDPGTR